MVSCYVKIIIVLQLVVVGFSMETVEYDHVYYITPSSIDPCLEEPCLTLSQLSANPSYYVSSGRTTLIFQPGIHNLSTTLTISNVQHFSMDSLSTAQNAVSTNIASVICQNSATFDFQSSGQIEVRNLKFIRCGGIKVSNVNKYVIEASNFLVGTQTVYRSRAHIFQSNFADSADVGVLYLHSSTAEVIDCAFSHNSDGVVMVVSSDIFISGSLFYNNSMADSSEVGVAIYAYYSKVVVHESNFSQNSAKESDAAAIYALDTISLTIYRCLFDKNTAKNMAGAVFIMRGWSAIVQNTIFSGNVALNGGALVINKAAVVIENCLFINNTARDGGAILAYVRIFIMATNTTFIGNTAYRSGVVYIKSGSADFLHSTTYSSNKGSLFVFNANVNISGNATFNKNSYVAAPLNIPDNSWNVSVDKGATIFAFQSTITFEGHCSMTNNQAETGGAINAIQSKLIVSGEVIISNNMATESGGGIFFSQSEMSCELGSRISLIGNSASQSGGGIHAISSFINVEFNVHPYMDQRDHSISHYEYLGSFLSFTENSASKGGGVYLEEGAKLYVLKKTEYRASNPYPDKPLKPLYVLTFASNSAEYGGAVYVSDKTYWGTCASPSYLVHSVSSECFLQTLGLHGRKYSNLNTANTNFENNRASVSGSTLFGGLLDRCTASAFAEVYLKSENVSIGGLDYLINTSTIQSNSESISSYAVRLCFCQNNQPECSYHTDPIHVKKGENFTLHVVAVDQFNETVSNLSIYSYLSSYEGTLQEGQQLQSTGDGCTHLTFSAFSLQRSEELIMYAKGPCGDAEMSRLKQQIEFLPCDCPIGFQRDTSDKTRCKCECDHRLEPYITKCNDTTGTLLREGDFWIDYISELNDFMIYPHCPLEYCQLSSSSISINLNSTNASDAQCTPYRAGVLCGACKPGLSLSLEGSKCVFCPKYWPALLAAIIIATLIAGILLLGLMLVLNLTVAIGTMNGIIFFANIVNVNKSLLFPFYTPNYVTVFISWLNLEIGFDTCFYEGMDAYGKTWLKLLFPLYLIFLVGVVIVLGEKSQRFAHVIGKRNPVAMLATLILLSFDKLFDTVIEVFSFATLNYPDGSHMVVWLPDANVRYLQGKHIPLFITALLVLAICIFYTVILFSWQWLLRCQGKVCLRWIRNQKLQLFLKSYHAPYTIKHRYWTGLLLIMRVLLSISSAVNMSNDPGLNLLLLGIVMIFLLVLVGQCSPIFENSVSEFIEVTFYVNIAVLFIFSLFFLQAGKHQVIIAYISGTAAIVQFVFAISYHVYLVFLSKTALCMKLKKIFKDDNQDDELMNYPPLNGDTVNPLRPALPSLDHHRGNYPTTASNDSNGVEEERGPTNTYGSYSRTVTRVSFEEEATENSPLIRASLKI